MVPASRVALALFVCLLSSPVAAAQCDAIRLAEILFDAPGADDGQQFVEIAGPPGAALAGWSLVVIDGDGAAAGIVEHVVPLSGALGLNGLLLIRDSAATLLPAPDVDTNVVVHDFVPDIGGGSVTFVLGTGAPPSAGLDLDVDDDGALDAGALAGFAVADAVAVLENDGPANHGYADDLGFENFGPFLGSDPAAHNPMGLFRLHHEECPCAWAGGVVLGPAGGPYEYDLVGNQFFGFTKKTLPPMQKNPGKRNQAGPAKCPLDEIIIFASNDAYGRMAEGYARQRLGLLNANGTLVLGQNGLPAPLISADGKKKGYDMAFGDKLVDALKELKKKGGTVSLVTHGCPGAILVEGNMVSGFDGGTGKPNCAPKIKPALTFAGIGKLEDVKLNVISCHAAKKGGAVTQDVAASFKKEIENQGGTVAAVVASPRMTWAGPDWGLLTFAQPLNANQLKLFSNWVLWTNLDPVATQQHFTFLSNLSKALFGPQQALTNLAYQIQVPQGGPGGADVVLKNLPAIVPITSCVCFGHGHGCQGTGNRVPVLMHDGCSFSGNTISIEVSEGLGGSIALLLAGVTRQWIPLASGCVLLNDAQLQLGPLPLSPGGPGDGAFVLPATLPTLPGTVTLYLQAVVLDPGVGAGYSTTNGLDLIIN